MPRAPHEHPLHRISSIARPVDPRFPSNKAILIVISIVLVGGSVWGWVRHEAIGQAAITGTTGVLVAFVSWALGRELDPDVNATAFVVLVAALGAWIVFDDAELVPLVVALAITRIVNRTVGPAAKLTDEIAVAALVGVVVLVAGRWSLGIAAAVAFVLDALLSGGRRRSWSFAVICLAFVACQWLRGKAALGAFWHPAPIAALAIGFVVAIVTLSEPESPCDLPEYRLDRRRIQGGMLVTLFAALGVQIETTGELAAPTLVAALVGTIMGRAWPRG
jgi:hypothetical protein